MIRQPKQELLSRQTTGILLPFWENTTPNDDGAGFSRATVNGLRDRIERMLRGGIRSTRRGSKNPLTALPLSHDL